MNILQVNILGHECLFDKEDFHAYYRYGMSVTNDAAGFYYVQFNCIPYRGQRFARVLLKAPSDLIVDHKDRNTLNNCKDNLRLATLSESAANRKVTWGTNKSQGVYKNKWGSYTASIAVNGRRIYLGSFPAESFAADAYKKAQFKYFGEFACLKQL